MSIRLTVELTINEGKSDEFEKKAMAAMAKVRSEDKGCEMYELFRSCDDDSRFAIVESWASQEDLDAHGKSPAMKVVGEAFAGMLASRPVMHQY